MSDYRYVVFPRGKQPTVDEADELKSLTAALSGRLAIGVHRQTGGLVVALTGPDYERSLAKQRGFAALIGKWEVRGAEVVDRCPFVKDATALRPMRPAAGSLGESRDDSVAHDATRLAAKELAAKEAIGRSLLSVQRTLDRYAALRRLASFAPWLLVGVGSLMLALAGFYVGHRLQSAGVEKRRDATIRVIVDPMGESRRAAGEGDQ